MGIIPEIFDGAEDVELPDGTVVLADYVRIDPGPGASRKTSNCGANAPGGGGFQPGNTCAAGGDGPAPKGKFDATNPPTPKQPTAHTGAHAVIAWMNADGTIYYDTSATMHGDVFDSFPDIADTIIDGGFIKDGKYIAGASLGGFSEFDDDETAAFIQEKAEEANAAGGAQTGKTLKTSDCGANAPGGGGFQPGNTCAAGSDYDRQPYLHRRHQRSDDGRDVKEMSLTEYIAEINRQGKWHAPDFMDREGQAELKRDIDRYPVLVAEKDGVEYRRSTEPLRYVAHTPDGDIARDDQGMAIMMTRDEMQAAGLPMVENGIVAFKNGEEVGFVGDSFGAVELRVEPNHRGEGIGKELSFLFRRENPFKDSGGFSDSGQASAERAYWRMTIGQPPQRYVSLSRQGRSITDQITAHYQETVRPLHDQHDHIAATHGPYSDEARAARAAQEEAFQRHLSYSRGFAAEQDRIAAELNRLRGMKPAEIAAEFPGEYSHGVIADRMTAKTRAAQ